MKRLIAACKIDEGMEYAMCKAHDLI